MIRYDMRRIPRFNPGQLADVAEGRLIGRFYRVGGLLRTVSRRSLRFARQKKRSEMTAEELEDYERKQRAFAEGLLHKKPRRPDIVSEKGSPPLLHSRPRSPLRDKILFSVDRVAKSVVVGPEKVAAKGTDVVERLEHEMDRAFMGPALTEVEPKISDLLKG